MMSESNEWVFKSGKCTLIRCYVCEKYFDVRAIRREDGFCPSCNNIEIDLSDDPYVEPLTRLESSNE